MENQALSFTTNGQRVEILYQGSEILQKIESERLFLMANFDGVCIMAGEDTYAPISWFADNVPGLKEHEAKFRKLCENAIKTAELSPCDDYPITTR